MVFRILRPDSVSVWQDKEILKRLSSGHSTVITYLSSMGYLKDITDEDYYELLRNPDYDLAENLIRGLANPRHSKNVRPIFLKMMDYIKEDLKKYARHMLKNLDSELYCGLKITGYFDSMEREYLEEILNDPNNILNPGKIYSFPKKISIFSPKNAKIEEEGFHE